MSLRDRILAADDIGKKLVHVKEWGLDIEVRTMTAGKRAEMMSAAQDNNGQIDAGKLWPMVIVATAYDPETGESLFTMADVDALKNKNAAAVEYLGSQAMEMSGFGAGAVDDAGKVS